MKALKLSSVFYTPYIPVSTTSTDDTVVLLHRVFRHLPRNFVAFEGRWFPSLGSSIGHDCFDLLVCNSFDTSLLFP